MKRLSTLLFLLLIAGTGGAQVVPNGTLETWNNIILYEDPANWSSPNQLTAILGITTVTKSTDASSGTYAARLEGAYIDAFQLNVPGAIGTGQIDATTQSFKGGFPLNGASPAALIGYYKYAPVGADSCLMFSVLFRWDAVNNQRDTVAIAYYSTGAVTDYTLFSAPFIPLSGETPDSAIVIISTSKDILTAQAGSTLYVDDIDLSGAVGLADPAPSLISVYPNPADESVTFSIAIGWNAARAEVIRIDGSYMSSYAVSAGDFRINTKQFPQGLYMCQLKDESGKIVAAGRFTVSH
jgi:hypothetical protein